MNNKNYRIELKHFRRDECSVSFIFDDLELVKNEDFDMFAVNSIIKTIEHIIHRKFNIKNYLNTYRFYQQLACIDKKLTKYGFVYLRIIDKDNKICKIGRTFNIQKRYSKELRESVKALVPVEDDVKVEKELIKLFSNKFTKVRKTNETFVYNNIRNLISMFKRGTDKYKVNVSYKESSHIKLHSDDKKHDKLYVSLPVCEMIFNNYVNSPMYIEKFNTMKNYIIDSLHEDVYISNEYNFMLKTKCVFWKFHKYTIIQNESDLYINGSRLWNSIIKNDNLDKQNKLSKFLKSKQIQKIKDQFEKFYPGEQLYRENIINKRQPHFSGIYVHYILIHFIIAYLNAEYAILVSELMYRQYYNNYLSNSTNKNMKGGNKLLSLKEYTDMLIKISEVD